jgi:2-polyprenyl-3-methyl-5-hydroxy-6-metoxy-1,4-benzoquinol methylase
VSEYDKRYVQKMKETNFSIPFIQESVYSLKRDDKSFDSIVMLEVLEHLENVELALRELTRVSRKYVVISVPHEPVWRILNLIRGKYVKYLGNTPGHINHWNPMTLKSLLSKYGKVKNIYLPLPWIIAVLEV